MPDSPQMQPKPPRLVFVEPKFDIVSGMKPYLNIFAALILVATAARADPPFDARALRAEDALTCVAARYAGEPLRIRDDDDGLVQEVRWLTPAGNVLEIELTGPGCRFLEVDGVGQTDALLMQPVIP